MRKFDSTVRCLGDWISSFISFLFSFYRAVTIAWDLLTAAAATTTQLEKVGQRGKKKTRKKISTCSYMLYVVKFLERKCSGNWSIGSDSSRVGISWFIHFLSTSLYMSTYKLVGDRNLPPTRNLINLMVLYLVDFFFLSVLSSRLSFFSVSGFFLHPERPCYWRDQSTPFQTNYS